MATRVKPEETQLQGAIQMTTHEMPSLMPSVRAVDESISAASPNYNHGAEQMLKAVDSIYSPILKAMKLFGMYFGETSVKRLSSVSSIGKRQVSISLLYCCAVVASLWFNFTMAFISTCVEGVSVLATFYSLTAYCIWCLHAALAGTICMVMLPLTDGKTSRFQIFIRKAIERKLDLDKVQRHSRKGLIVAGIVFILASLSLMIFFVYLPVEFISDFKPWNGRYILKVFSHVSLLYSVAAWLFPTVFFSTTCLALEQLFDNFYEKLSPLSSNFVDFSALRDDYSKLCEVVELASKMFSPFLLGITSLYIPMMCFQFYIMVNPTVKSEHAALFYVFGNLFFLLGSAGILAVVMVFGSRINEKVSIQKQFDHSNHSTPKDAKLQKWIKNSNSALNMK